MTATLVKVLNSRDQSVVGARVRLANSFWARFRGLMLVPELAEGEGLLISPCNSIHMMFMRFPIDAIFLDSSNCIRAVYEKLRPWTGFSGWHRDVSSVLELKSGSIQKTGIRVNDTLRMEQIEC